MDHLAIMKKSLGFLEKIVSGEKTIESRWYSSKRAPWNRISQGDNIFFKNSGQPVTVKTKVKKVLQFGNLTQWKIKAIIEKYGKAICIVNSENFFQDVKNKKYCILVFLEDIKVVKPFLVDKKGFGNMTAWISVENINSIKQ